MLYAGVCPAATLIIYAYFLVQNKADEFNQMYYRFRKIVSQRATTNASTALFETVVILVVVLNCLILYIVSPSFNAILDTFCSTNPEEANIRQIFAVVCIEHILLLMIVITKKFIPDMPAKVQ